MESVQEGSPAIKWETAADIRWAALPLLAAFGGAYVYKSTSDPLFNSTLLMMLALVLGGWVPLWMAVADTDWAFPLGQWQDWNELEPLPWWPYLQTGTAGSILHKRLSQARMWWKKIGRTTLAAPLHQAILALLASLILGYSIGRTALLLSLMYLASTQLAALWSGGKHIPGTGWFALTQVGLPWLLGASLEQGIQVNALVSGLVIIILVGLYTLNSPLAFMGPIITAVYLIWQDHTVIAGWFLLLALPGFLKLGQNPTPVEYRKTTLPWALCMIGLMILVL